MNFFDMEFEAQKKKNAPLADRMRPDSPDEVYGQEHLLGKGMPIRRMLDEGAVRSMILVGPPGTGKTTIAKMIARSVHYAFLELSAVTSGVRICARRSRVRKKSRRRRDARRFSSSTRFTATTRRNRTRSSRMWSRAS